MTETACNLNTAMSRQFVIGDIHGAYRALRQCLARSDFDYDNDHLISLGDVADGWPETRDSIDELLRIKNLTYILGNHDWWTLQWMLTGNIEDIWYIQGGKATIDSYADAVPERHIKFLTEAALYHVQQNRLFVHAGIDPSSPIEKQNQDTFLWDRRLASFVLRHYPQCDSQNISSFDEIFLGHTPIPFGHPINCMGIWMMDTGAGWSGVLSMMNLETKEIFTSDRVPDLYPGVEGRKRKTHSA